MLYVPSNVHTCKSCKSQLSDNALGFLTLIYISLTCLTSFTGMHHFKLLVLLKPFTFLGNCSIHYNSLSTNTMYIHSMHDRYKIVPKLGFSGQGCYMNCYTKEVIFDRPGLTQVVFCGERQAVPSCVISTLTAFRMISEGYQAYLAHVVDRTQTVKEVSDIPVVCEFLDVFPEDLPGQPPDRETEFTIEVTPGVTPISIPVVVAVLSPSQHMHFVLVDVSHPRPRLNPSSHCIHRAWVKTLISTCDHSDSDALHA